MFIITDIFYKNNIVQYLTLLVQLVQLIRLHASCPDTVNTPKVRLKADETFQFKSPLIQYRILLKYFCAFQFV